MDHIVSNLRIELQKTREENQRIKDRYVNIRTAVFDD